MHDLNHGNAVSASEAPGLPMTRNELVRQEGRDAAARQQARGDNPYRPGSADWRAWVEGFDFA